MASKFSAWPVLTALLLMLGGVAWRLDTKPQAIGGAENRSGTTTHDVAPVVAHDDVWPELGKRPLAIPTLATGATCPVTPTREVLPGQRLPGDGPIYNHFRTDAGPLHYGSGREDGGWYYIKILWRASGDYTGPALIRGAQLDGNHELRFGDGASPPTELRFPVETGVRSEYTVNGWRDFPSYTRLSAPGCYAWQIDGLDFRTIIIFRAEP